MSAKGHGQGRGPQGGCQQQAGKELAGPLHAQFHFAAAKGGLQARGVDAQGRTARLPAAADVRAQEAQGLEQLVHGALVQTPGSVEVKGPAPGGQHGREQATAGAGSAHIAVQGRGLCAAPGLPGQANDPPAAFPPALRGGQGGKARAGGGQHGAGVVRIVTDQSVAHGRNALGQGRAQQKTVGKGFGRGGAYRYSGEGLTHEISTPVLWR